jgi:hypothetical protein
LNGGRTIVYAPDAARELDTLGAQIIVSPAGERLAVLPEADYLLLLAASEVDEGEAHPEFLEEVRRRRASFAATRIKNAEGSIPLE